ncbi:MAG: hypothetical protein NTY72_12175 [Bacteroidetes bacterium]|nr:hypothetical protein [Bacteroidota bacterium]
MSITRRYVIFDELEKEERALLNENKIKNTLIQDIKNPIQFVVEDADEVNTGFELEMFL